MIRALLRRFGIGGDAPPPRPDLTGKRRAFALKGPAGDFLTDVAGRVVLFESYGAALRARRHGERVAMVAVDPRGLSRAR